MHFCACITLALFQVLPPIAASVNTTAPQQTGLGESPDAGSSPTVIHAAFALVSLLEIDEERGEISVSCFLKASWAASDAADPFRPRLTPLGARRVTQAGFLTPVISVETDGAFYHQAVLLTVVQSCPFAYAGYPFDTQTCEVRVGPAERRAALAPPRNGSAAALAEPGFDEFAADAGFTARLGGGRLEAAAPGDGRPALAVPLRLRRGVRHFLLRLYAPHALWVSAGWLSALVPASLIRSRLPATILGLLTLLLSGLAAHREPGLTSGRTAASVWQTGCLTFSVVSVMQAVLDTRLVVRAVDEGDPRWERYVRKGGRLYFWGYAAAWVLFCLVYFLTYVPSWNASLDDL